MKFPQGNKKGPLTRWDFEDEDKYNAYMEKREAMPKAAFQFGIKMSDGRLV
jgi:IK cytokine